MQHSLWVLANQKHKLSTHFPSKPHMGPTGESIPKVLVLHPYVNFLKEIWWGMWDILTSWKSILCPMQLTVCGRFFTRTTGSMFTGCVKNWEDRLCIGHIVWLKTAICDVPLGVYAGMFIYPTKLQFLFWLFLQLNLISFCKWQLHSWYVRTTYVITAV